VRTEQFWVTANGNFLDHCVLEWCKLFGDPRGKHHWRKIVTDQGAFYTRLLHTVGLSEAQFEAYIEEMRTYRDKFVAHLDLDEVMHIPRLRLARRSVVLLHNHILDHEDDGGFFPDAPMRAAPFYTHYANEARTVYAD